MLRKILSILLLLAAMNAHAESSLQVSILSDQVANSTGLGQVDIDGVGAVNLVAQKNGNQLIVHAQGPDGTVIGKSESVVGLRDTPIYIKTPDGLKKITIYWGSN